MAQRLGVGLLVRWINRADKWLESWSGQLRTFKWIKKELLYLIIKVAYNSSY